MKLLILILILFSLNSYSQTVSLSTVFHDGTYTGGFMNPDYDYDLSVSIPMTEKIDLSTSIYLYNASYNEKNTSFYWKEKFWYITLTFSYTFSSEPLFK